MSREYGEDRLVQQTTVRALEELGWKSVFAQNAERLGLEGTLGREHQGEVVLIRSLRRALEQLNPGHPPEAYAQAVETLTAVDASKSLLQVNEEKYVLLRDGVPVSYEAEDGARRTPRLMAVDFTHPERNELLAVRELWLEGSHHRRRADIVGFINGLPLLFIELKRHDKTVRSAYEQNLSDYLDTIPHLFHHNVVCILSNGIDARVGAMVSPWDYFQPWKRLREEDEGGRVALETMLRGICDPRRFLDLVESFVLFDHSRPGGTVKALAANHQYLGVNRAFEAMQDREVRKGKLGVFWHTQGSGKSYSMVWLTRKAHRKLQGSFTFVIVTDREDLDQQIAKTFAGTGAVSDAQAVHARSGGHLRELLRGDHRYIFTLIHKFNQDDDEPYTERDDVVVIADEAHRTQYGRLAENMRRVLPNASYIAFTGTPLMKSEDDQLTRAIFGDYVSKYDFAQAVEDGATVPLYYDNRGEKLKLVDPEVNDRIAEELDRYTLDEDQEEKLRRDLGREYHILTADSRLHRVAEDLTAHFSRRWQTGKAMLVCLDKITCVRMHDKIRRFWEEETTRQGERLVALEAEARSLDTKLAGRSPDTRVRVLDAQNQKIEKARKKLRWLERTEIAVVISPDQNEVKTFREWDLDILPHREKIHSRNLDDEFKDPEHPFRLAIVCAMWLTGFDVPSLATLYIDKPMKGHTLMQAIARANRREKEKNNGHLVDYNGMLKSLRAALAKYGDGIGPGGGADAGGEKPPAEDLEALRDAFAEALVGCEEHLATCGFELAKLVEAQGFEKLGLLDRGNEASAVNAACRTPESRARFEVLAREVFKKRRALVSEPELVAPYRRRANAVDAIYKQLEENRDAASIAHVIRALHDIVGSAVKHRPSSRRPGADSGKLYDISRIDFERLRQEFEMLPNRNTALLSLQDAVERKLNAMLLRNPLRMDFFERYREIIETYNRETDRVTIEQTFEALVRFVADLSDEDQRGVREGLAEDQLAIFDLLIREKEGLSTRERNRVKEVAGELLARVRAEVAKLQGWQQKEQTRSAVRTLILNHLFSDETGLPEAYSPEEAERLAKVVYLHVYRQAEAANDNRVTFPAAAGAETLQEEVSGSGGLGGSATRGGTGSEGTADPVSILPFRPGSAAPSASPERLPLEEVEPFVNSVPIVELEAAAGGFSVEQYRTAPGNVEWVVLSGRTKPAPDLFVARVTGRSMNRRIPDGAWCLWRSNPAGTRQGRVVLAQLRDRHDPEHDARYTVKVYDSSKEPAADGGWRHTEIRLLPDSDDPTFEPIVFHDHEEGGLAVVAELVEVLE